MGIAENGDIATSSMPVRTIPGDDTAGPPEAGKALCLSGGGYRAMVFHLGALWRLHELGTLFELKRISSVSGGSITAAALALAWRRLAAAKGDIELFKRLVVDPVRRMARETIDRGSIIGGIFLPGTISDRIANAYDEYLFNAAPLVDGGAHKPPTLQDLPDEPRFVINATNVQSGALWRFSKPYMGDWRVGRVLNPNIRLAVAVAASSAFPPVLSPAKLELRHEDFTPDKNSDLCRKPFTTDVVLSDGGVYDNLGMETAWKRYDTILVSDAGGKMAPQPEPKEDWAQHSIRVLDVIDNQVRSLRKRQMIAAFKLGAKKVAEGGRDGTYFGIRTDIADYKLGTAMPVPHGKSLELAAIETRLRAMDDAEQERLINWGYAVCDAAMRKHVVKGDSTPVSKPYPKRPW